MALRFDKNVSLSVKGLAILMMVAHHLYTDSIDDLGSRLDFYGCSDVWCSFGAMCKLCVSLFMFVGGYGSCIMLNRKSAKERVVSILWRFWILLLLLSPILLYFHKTSITEIIVNAFCLSSSVNGSWWFLQTYIIYIALLPVYGFLTKMKWNYQVVVIIFFTVLNLLAPKVRAMSIPLSTELHYVMYYLLIYYSGMLVCKNKFVDIVCHRHKSGTAIFIGCVLFGTTIVFRVFTGLSVLNPITCFSICLLMIYFCNSLFVYLGKHSMNIWLLHMFFIKEKYLGQWVANITCDPVFAYIIVFTASLAISVSVFSFEKCIREKYCL